MSAIWNQQCTVRMCVRCCGNVQRIWWMKVGIMCAERRWFQQICWCRGICWRYQHMGVLCTVMLYCWLAIVFWMSRCLQVSASFVCFCVIGIFKRDSVKYFERKKSLKRNFCIIHAYFLHKNYTHPWKTKNSF